MSQPIDCYLGTWTQWTACCNSLPTTKDTTLQLLKRWHRVFSHCLKLFFSLQVELMENLFDCLCSLMLEVTNRERFLKGEGLQLMNLMLR